MARKEMPRKDMMRKDQAPLVVTYADHEVITPPNELRKAVALASADDDDPIARAEAALVQLSSEFSGWMQAECERIETARQAIKLLGMTEHTHDALFRACHDVKGEAATFGYPEVVGVADSLCRLLEHTPEIAQIPLLLVDQHVDAVRAMTRENARSDKAEVATELVRRLREVTDDFLKSENDFRPDYLEIIFAPPLVPGTADS
jgi:HPt (histidine-containing phosphotransfer) domain-containing protein